MNNNKNLCIKKKLFLIIWISIASIIVATGFAMFLCQREPWDSNLTIIYAIFVASMLLIGLATLHLLHLILNKEAAEDEMNAKYEIELKRKKDENDIAKTKAENDLAIEKNRFELNKEKDIWKIILSSKP